MTFVKLEIKEKRASCKKNMKIIVSHKMILLDPYSALCKEKQETNGITTSCFLLWLFLHIHWCFEKIELISVGCRYSAIISSQFAFSRIKKASFCFLWAFFWKYTKLEKKSFNTFGTQKLPTNFWNLWYLLIDEIFWLAQIKKHYIADLPLILAALEPVANPTI